MPPPEADARAGTPALQRLVDALDPNPVYPLAPSWDLLARNRSEAGLVGPSDAGDGAGPNLIRMVFTLPRIRTLLADWPGQARALLEQYRAGADRDTGDESFERLTADLCRDSEEFRSWWGTHDVAEFRAGPQGVRPPRTGPADVRLREAGARGHPGRHTRVVPAVRRRSGRKAPGSVRVRRAGRPGQRLGRRFRQLSDIHVRAWTTHWAQERAPAE
ncbi:hypothetical protein ACIQM0_20785 [Streptomyces sp. NPDC091387]|uniref:MmyB family transcriptional regulator n=1 Tax=Streptomyces sp. NPDC091387 TaxID=3365998 RepID=UPI00380F99EB